MQKTFAIIGPPAPSPLATRMLQAALGAISIEANLEMFDIKIDQPEDLENFCYEAAYKEITGFSVGNPYSQAIMRLMDYYDPLAKKIGAVDTVVSEENNLIGYNATAFAIATTLKEKMDPQGRKALVLGAEGSARACCYSLKQGGAEVYVFGQDIQRAEGLARDLKLGMIEYRQIKEEDFEIIIHTTSIGEAPRNQESLLRAEQIKPGALVMESLLEPLETQLVKEARKAKAEVITGDRVLLHLVAKQFELWTGKPAPMEVMEKVMIREIKQKG